jgi:hypothetical protein
MLSEDDLRRLGGFMERYPDVPLRAYGGYDGTIVDLEFLRFFPRLRRFSADALRYHEFNSIEGLRFLPDDLLELGLGRTKRRLSLLPLARFQSMRKLYLEAQTKDIDVISALTELEDVTLRSTTLTDLSLLTPLRQLRSLDLKLGGTRDMGLLASLTSLTYLELWMIRGLQDISMVGELSSLQYLFLQDLARVDRLPDMSRMSSLRRLHLQNLKLVSDLTPLLRAPVLEELVIVESRHLTMEDLACLAGHPSLTHAVVALGSRKKNEAAKEMLRLPRPPEPFAFR